MRGFYLILALLGLFIPYSAFLPWLLNNGLDISLLLDTAVSNQVSQFAWLDVLVSAVVIIGFILVDGHRKQIKHRYLAVFGTVTVGVSFGLPLYLYLREKAEDEI
ncbi:DUF2834 domain-containing protein [Pseudoalteromonas luteoviolacea]|uniref:DUF2834 domain-containing protein n=1 Tax=Pseudoalteromonas luteoviolacea TaxID=43657 RepID=UPI00114F91AF|nr:DUF2834 domain-containing protein [Pseudoalteromonas luteoviolacea]TQF70076.1 DUF2834 domain-containing protein [Pseudoalteromonas luteoviolacea]